ncbi:MAG: F0F1 ATP synthase subunit B [Lachnospiraceae bacterium]|nr:F0F1 ATP synthase subunit B [Lachnospiraceae bacterium]
MDVTRLFGLDLQTLADAFFTGINIFILFLAFGYLCIDMIRDFIRKRQDKIKGELDFAASEKQDAIALKEEYDAKLRNVNLEANEILDEARKKALKKEAEIIDQAKQEAARILARAENEIELEKKKALEDVKQEMISIASLMAAKVVSANIDTAIQDSMVDETLKEIGENTWLS